MIITFQAKGILFNGKPPEKGKVLEKEKEKEGKEKEKSEKEKEKEKPKAKVEKEKEKKPPKPRLSTGAASVSSEQSPKSENSSPNASNPPSTPKQRGRKPSTVKTPTDMPDTKVVTETQNPVSVSSGSPRQSPLPGLVLLPTAPFQSSSPSLMAPAVETSPRPSSSTVLGPEMLPKTVATQLQEIAQPSTTALVSDIAKQMEVTLPAVTTTLKETPKQSTGGSTTKKRAAPKTGDEPKRKVGRPPLKNKTSSSPGNLKKSSPTSSTNTVTSPLNTAFPSTFPQDGRGTASPPTYFSNQNFFSGGNQAASVPQNGPRTPSPNPYRIPQPRSRGLLENGHVQRPNNVSQGPL